MSEVCTRGCVWSEFEEMNAGIFWLAGPPRLTVVEIACIRLSPVCVCV